MKVPRLVEIIMATLVILAGWGLPGCFEDDEEPIPEEFRERMRQALEESSEPETPAEAAHTPEKDLPPFPSTPRAMALPTLLEESFGLGESLPLGDSERGQLARTVSELCAALEAGRDPDLDRLNSELVPLGFETFSNKTADEELIVVRELPEGAAGGGLLLFRAGPHPAGLAPLVLLAPRQFREIDRPELLLTLFRKLNSQALLMNTSPVEDPAGPPEHSPLQAMVQGLLEGWARSLVLELRGSGAEGVHPELLLTWAGAPELHDPLGLALRDELAALLAPQRVGLWHRTELPEGAPTPGAAARFAAAYSDDHYYLWALRDELWRRLHETWRAPGERPLWEGLVAVVEGARALDQ